MYERHYGAKYKELGGCQPASHIAKLMRADIKAELAAGNLPGAMANYSVRIHNYSGGRSINIEARDLDGMWQQCEGIIPGSEDGFGARGCGNVWCKGGGEYKDHPSADYHDILSAEGQRIQKVLQKIHDAYNYDGSESMVDYFDVNYYGSASISTIEEDERRKARKAARKAA